VTVNGEIKPPQAKKGGEILIRGAGVSPGYWDPSVDAPGTAGHGRASNGMAAKNASDFIPDPTDEVRILLSTHGGYSEYSRRYSGYSRRVLRPTSLPIRRTNRRE
jgi:hypothetical protein